MGRKSDTVDMLAVVVDVPMCDGLGAGVVMSCPLVFAACRRHAATTMVTPAPSMSSASLDFGRGDGMYVYGQCIVTPSASPPRPVWEGRERWMSMGGNGEMDEKDEKDEIGDDDDDGEEGPWKVLHGIVRMTMHVLGKALLVQKVLGDAGNRQVEA